MKRRVNRSMKLADVIRIVSKCTHDDVEASLVVADLINRGVVKLQGRYHNCRVIVS